MKKPTPTPPKLAERLLLWFLKEDLAEEVLGDLEEKFYHTQSNYSKAKARRNYWYQVFRYMRPFALKRNRSARSNPATMLKHNLLISYRSFLRFRSTFFINLIGLASGLAGTLLIYLWVADEISIDKFHEKDARIYQILRNRTERDGQINTHTSMPGRLADELMANYPEVEAATMVWPPNFFGGQGYTTHQNEQYKADVQFVDQGFLNIMSFPLIAGNPTNALQNKSDVLISRSFAQKVFGSIDDAIGQTLNWNKGRATGDYIVNGVFENPPKNSTMQFDMLLNAEVMMEAYKYMEQWGNTNPDALVLLKEGTDHEAFNTKLEKLMQSKVENSRSTLFIQKFSDRYLRGSYENGAISGGRIAYVRLFSIVALIILSIACINFMNLSTAKAAGRLKEIGVKKALGAKRRALIGQYFTESFLLTILSVLLALGIVVLFLPQFNQVTGKTLAINLSTELLSSMAIIVLITGFLSGSYPALYLSRLKTTASLKGKLVKNLGDLWVRRGLVVFQFSISIILIFSVLIISKQIDFIQSKDLGYDRENVLRVPNTGISESAYDGFLTSLETIPGVVSTSSLDHNLMGDHGSTSNVDWPGKTPDQEVNFVSLEMSSGFIETMGMELAQGRTFERGRPNEGQKIVLNETAIEQMGLEDPIGKVIILGNWDDAPREIIGIVKDIHAESLYETILPTFIQVYPMASETIIKIQAGTEASSLLAIEEQFEEFNNGVPFDFTFMDSDYQAMYENEKRISSLSRFFALIAIIISCLGLLGLTAFTAERRTKEIGIRKVLGSGNWRIIQMLSVDFTRMVVAALAIALPISYVFAKGWLQDFAYSIDLTSGFFILSGSIILGVAWLTVGMQTLKAARANPVDSLRSE